MNTFKLWLLALLALPAVIGFGGCEKQAPSTELRQVHWDRDMCQRCTMVVSDRKYSVQVIDPKNGKSYMFDDLGCAILWFQEEKAAWLQSAKFWVTDAQSGEWIDGKTAFYDTDSLTPMGYGFGAHKDKTAIKETQEALSFDAIVKRLANEKESRHGETH